MSNYSLGTVQGEIRIDYDGKGVKEAQADVKAAAKQLEREKLQLKLGADRAQLTKDLSVATAELQKWAAMEPTAEVNVEVEKARARMLALEAQLAALDRKRIEIQVDIDNNRLEQSASKLLASFGGLRSRVSDFGADVRNTRSAVEGLGSVMSGLAKPVFLAGVASTAGQTVAALTPLLGSILLLPAMAFGAAAAFGVLKIGTSGMGDAFKAVADGDAKKLAEAMAKLSPEAQNVVRSYQQVKPALDSLKMDVQNRLMEGYGNVIKMLASTLLPTLHEGLVTVAGGLNETGHGLATALTAPQAADDLAVLLENISQFLYNASSAAGNFIVAFLRIAAIGSQFLPQMGTSMAGIAEQFREWAYSAEGTAKLTEWIRNGVQAFTDLYYILVNVAQIVVGIFRPLQTDGQTALGVVRQLAAEVANWVNSAEGQRQIAAVWQFLSVVGGQLMAVIQTIAPILGQLVTWFSSLPGPVQSVIGSFIGWATVIGLILTKTAPLIAFFIQIGPLIMKLGPALSALVTGFKAVMTAFRALSLLMMTNPWILLIAAVIALVALIIANWDTIWAYLQGIWATITGAWNTFVNFLTSTGSSVWSTISAAWTSAISAISSFFSGVWEGVKSVWQTVITALTTAGSNVWTVISGIWQSVIGALTAWFTTVWTVVSTAFQAVVDTIIAIGSAVWETIKTIWFAAILTIWALLTGKFDLLGQIWTTLIEKIKAIGSNLWNTISGIWSSAISTIVSTVTDFVSRVVTAVSDFVSRVVSFFTNLGSQIVSTVTSFARRVIQGWQNIITTVVSAVTSFVQRVIQGWQNLGQRVVQIISDLATQGPSKISQMVSNIINYVSNLASQFAAKISQMASQAVSRMGQLASQIVSAISSLPGRMVSLGSSIIQGIISGISGAAGRLFSYLGGLATQALNAAKAAFGINSPSKLFRDTIGEGIPEGIEVGVEGNVAGMLKSVNDLAGMAQKAALDALSRPELARVGSLVGAGVSSNAGATLGASTVAAYAPTSGQVPMQIGALTVNVKGIVDPNDPVAWRRFGEEVRELIMDVEDSYK